LVTARRTRRERHAPPVEVPQPQPRAEWFPPCDWERTGALVRPYVAALSESPTRGNSITWAGGWGSAQ
jgi:hypothetical protein